MKYYLSYGGGVNSTALAVLLKNYGYTLDGIVFADTGNEIPETYYYIKEYFEPWCMRNGIEFVTVFPGKKRSLFTRCWDRMVIPDTLKRWCTRDVKVLPIHRFYKTLNEDVTQYLGIHSKESHRIKPSGEDWITNEYPLIDELIDQDGCIKIIEDEGLPMPVKSGCFFCPYNSKSRWAWLEKTHPNLYNLTNTLNLRNKHYPRQSLFKIEDSMECGSSCMT